MHELNGTVSNFTGKARWPSRGNENGAILSFCLRGGATLVQLGPEGGGCVLLMKSRADTGSSLAEAFSQKKAVLCCPLA